MGRLIWSRNIPAPYEGLVASRPRMLTARDTTNKQAMSRYAVFASEALTSIKVVFSNFDLSTGTDSGVGAANVGTASIEYPAGTFTALRSGGSTALTTPDGGLLFCDYLSVNIPAGATFWIRQYITNTNGIVYLDRVNATLGDAATFGVSGVADQTLGGTVSSSGSVVVPPIAIIGQTINASVIVVGDSIGFGTDSNGDPNGVTFNSYGNGLITPSLGSVPFLNLSWPSQTAQNWISKSPARKLLVPYGSHLIQQLSTNDIIAARSQAAIVTDLQAIYALARVGQKVFQTTSTPHATSSDAFATTGNQTALELAARTTFNNAVRAIISGSTGYFDTASALETAQNSDIWKASPAPPYTNDGLHPVQAGYDLVKNSGVIGPITYP